MPSVKARPLKTENSVEKQQLSWKTDDYDLKYEGFDWQMSLNLTVSLCVLDHRNPHVTVRSAEGWKVYHRGEIILLLKHIGMQRKMWINCCFIYFFVYNYLKIVRGMWVFWCQVYLKPSFKSKHDRNASALPTLCSPLEQEDTSTNLSKAMWI